MKESKTKLIVDYGTFKKVEFTVTEKFNHGTAMCHSVIGSCSAREMLAGADEGMGWVRATRVLNGLLDETIAAVEKARKAKKSVKKLVAPTFEFSVTDGKGKKARTRTYLMAPNLDQLVA